MPLLDRLYTHKEPMPLGNERTVAALFVAAGGAYYDISGVDAWDEARDARLYAGPHPVVAHPPCQRWGKMWFGSPLAVKRTGIRKIKGDDGGCFAAALSAVKEFGGVIEHPEGSHAWAHFGLNKPPRNGGWVKADDFGGWTCCVEQGRYGHYARKPTWLVAYHCDLPELDWGKSAAQYDPAVIERLGLARAKRLGEVCARGGGVDSKPRISTPEPFRNMLIAMARSVNIEVTHRKPIPWAALLLPRNAQLARYTLGKPGHYHKGPINDV